MDHVIKIIPPLTPSHFTIELPQSKSIVNRLLILNYLSGNKIHFDLIDPCDDIQLLMRTLANINYAVSHNTPMVLHAKNTGTVARFLTTLLSIIPGKFFLTGNNRMKERPIKPLVDAMIKMGADISFADRNNKLPLLINGKKLAAKEIQIDATLSSQFITALLLIAPFLPSGLKIKVLSENQDNPYTLMTIDLLRYFSIKAEINKNDILVEKGNIKERYIKIETDWSAAAFWYEIAALQKNANFRLSNLSKESLQGDSVLPLIYKSFGVETDFQKEGIILRNTGNKTDHFETDLTKNPDLALPIIATCAGLNISCKFLYPESLRHKESDRLHAVTDILSAAGKVIKTSNDCFSMEKGILIMRRPVKTYQDHRIAMSFAPLSIITGSIEIEKPEVVTKSYPLFWDNLKKAGFEIIR